MNDDAVPASVFVIDLVDSSSKSKAEIDNAQRIMEQVIESAFRARGLRNIRSNYTGDGYLCALVLEDSFKLVETLSDLVPKLKDRLGQVEQSFRIGVDFGFIRLQDNKITGMKEHFDTPGIVATRLQSACDPDHVLFSEHSARAFMPFFPNQFAVKSVEIQSKNQSFSAREFLYGTTATIEKVVVEYILDLQDPLPSSKTRLSVLVVEDEDSIRQALRDYLTKRGFQCECSENGVDALKKILNRETAFDVIVTDYRMDVLGGEYWLRALQRFVPNQCVVITSGFIGNDQSDVPFPVIRKPYDYEALVENLMLFKVGRFWQSLQECFGDPSSVFDLLTRCREILRQIRKHFPSSSYFDTLIRHKAKDLVYDCSEKLRPFMHGTQLLSGFQKRLENLLRLLSPFITKQHQGIDYVTLLREYIAEHRSGTPSIELQMDISEDVLSSFPNELSALLLFVIFEMVDNATDALPNYIGVIRCNLSLQSLRRRIVVCVCNSGRTLDPNTKDAIFAEGYSTKGDNRGLGLHLISTFVKEFHGTISVNIGEDTCFVIDLPLDDVLGIRKA